MSLKLVFEKQTSILLGSFNFLSYSSMLKYIYLCVCLSAASFSSCPQSCPALGSFPMSWLFASGGQNTEASATVEAHFPFSSRVRSDEPHKEKCPSHSSFLLTLRTIWVSDALQSREEENVVARSNMEGWVSSPHSSINRAPGCHLTTFF